MMNWIKFIPAALLSLLIVGCARENASAKTSNSKDEAEIKRNAQAYEEAYNSHDADKVASFWATNAVYVIPDSEETINGRNAIKDYFKELFANKDNPTIKVIVDQIDFQGANKAIENGHVTFTYPNDTQDETAYKAENIKENGKWVLQTVREIETGAATSNSEQLQDLAWLIGDWEDADENSNINLNFKWDKNNNFLIEHFAVKVLGREELTGIQIIGWDPGDQKIRSWVFDSDGGIREGSWSKEGDNWVANMKSTLADGKRASSADIYTKVDSNNFTFSMDARDVDGEILPDVGPVKFIKK